MLLSRSKNYRRAGSVIVLALSLFLLSAVNSGPTPEQQTQRYVSEQLEALERSLLDFEAMAPRAGADSLRQQFRICRAYYKRIEFLVEYYYPGAASRINGAALLKADADEPAEPQHPTGFQVLEEFVFDDIDDHARLNIVREISSTSFQVRLLKNYCKDLQPDAVSLLDALRLNSYRLIAKGISGFDSPAALNSLPEARETLESMGTLLGYYDAPASLSSKVKAAAAYLEQHNDFDRFDRSEFLRSYFNPVLHELYAFQQKTGIPFSGQARAVRTDVRDIFEEGAFNRYYFAPSGTEAPTPEQVALGRKLFYDPVLSAGGKRSCSSCHQPDKAFTDGLAVNSSLFGDRQLLRNTPTLVNVSLQPVQFADSRITFLEDQVHAVVSNEHEMGGDFRQIVQALKRGEYTRDFSKAFPGKEPVTDAHVKKALAAYIRSLTSLNSRFDRYMRGEEQAMNAEEVNGFNLFMGKAKCGTCHYAPLFSGAVPPLYDEMESEVLGVPANTDTLHAVLDADSGKYHLYRMPHQLRSFKTPGLRNIALTAPYMHNGVYKTLEEVIDFYDRGGGAGLGLTVENQTLPVDRLFLTATEKKALIAFLGALTDTSISGLARH